MIFRIKGFNLEILIEEETSPVLVILDKPVFRSIVNAVYENIKGNSNNDIVIEDHDKKIIKYSKRLFCIDEYLNLDFSTKNIISNLYREIENTLNFDVDAKMKYEYDIRNLSSSLYKLTDGIDFEISYNSNVSVMNVLKLFDFQVTTVELNSILDKLLTLISIYSSFQIVDLIIFVNLRSYYNDREIKEIYKSLKYKKMKYFCIETQLYDKIGDEDIYIIDEDLVEIDYSK